MTSRAFTWSLIFFFSNEWQRIIHQPSTKIPICYLADKIMCINKDKSNGGFPLGFPDGFPRVSKFRCCCLI